MNIVGFSFTRQTALPPTACTHDSLSTISIPIDRPSLDDALGRVHVEGVEVLHLRLDDLANLARVTLPTFTRFGVPLPFSTPARFSGLAAFPAAPPPADS